MNSYPVLSNGCLSRIIKENERFEKPLVQILGAKQVYNSYIRIILFDGINTLKLSIVKSSPQNDNKYRNGELEMFSVIRLNEYQISTLDKKDAEVLIINDFTLIMRGTQINRKLDAINTTADNQLSRSLVNNISNVSLNADNSSHFGQSMASNGKQNNCVIDVQKVCPITAITPFFNSWVIRGRITSKTPIRTYNNTKGEGKVFSFDVTDDSSEIRVTAFNTECDKYFNIIERDMIYYISKGGVKPANKTYSNLKSEYEITLTSESIIELCNECLPLPKLKFKFVSIENLTDSQLRVGSSVDVIGVIRTVDDLQTIVSKKNNKEYQKREISLLDKSLFEVRLTVWGKEAEDFNASVGHILAVKNAVIGEFRGRNLSCVQSSTLEVDPDLTEAHILKGWYDRESRIGITNVTHLSKSFETNANESKYMFLCQINKQSIPESSVLYYFSKATIITTNRMDKHLYKSCGKNGCMKKVREENGFYFCDKCGNNSTDFKWRLMISICCADTTGDIWLTAFQEVAEKITGRTVNELSELYERDPNEYQSIISQLNFKSFIFRIGSKVEEYNNEYRVKSTCFAAIPVDPIETSKKLIQNLKFWLN